MKEAEKASLKESERIEKEIAEMKEMKVRLLFSKHGACCLCVHANILSVRAEKDQHDDSRRVLCEAP
jgi:F-type H+-transporting ATPase subunit d